MQGSFKIFYLSFGHIVTVHTPLSREVFWHEYAKIPRHTSQNAITEGDFKCILTRNCEGTEQLQFRNKRKSIQDSTLHFPEGTTILNVME